MSFDASGTIGGAITFSKWKGRNYIRRHAIPSNPKTGAQVATRAMMRFLTTQWASLTAGQQAEWAAQATSDNITPLNAFVRYNMKRWTQFGDPFMDLTGVASTVPTLGALSLTGGVGQLTGLQNTTALNDGWGLLWALSKNTGFTPAKTDIVYVNRVGASSTSVVLTGLTPGVWYVRTAAFGKNLGFRTAFVAQQSTTVT